MASANPPNFPRLVAHAKSALPNAPGVYYFKNSKGKVLYVGKSIRIRDRVLQHIYSAREDIKEARLCVATTTVEHVLTGTELIALLLESSEIKEILPPFNIAQRRLRGLWGWRLLLRKSQHYEISTEHVSQKGSFLEEQPFVREFLSFRAAESRREEMLKMGGFCLDPGSGRPCFWQQIDKCKGACSGAESAQDYNARLLAAVQNSSATMFGNQVIVGKGRRAREKSFVVITDGLYRGFGFINASQINSPQSLEKAIVNASHNWDVQRILRAYFNEKEKPVDFYGRPPGGREERR